MPTEKDKTIIPQFMRHQFVKTTILACCLAAISCGHTEGVKASAEYAVLTVETTDRTIPSVYSASIRGRQDIEIYPQVSGTISRLCVTEGQRVEKGQTLFIIDQVPYKAALQTAEANVEAAKAGVATAELVYESKKELFAEEVISEFELSTARNNLLTAKAQLSQAEAQRVNAANNLSYTMVKSPSEGVVGVLPFRVGALVGPTIRQPLTTVSDNSEMYVYFSLSERRLLELTRSYGSIDKALKEMPEVSLQLNDGSLYADKGRIETISGVIDPRTGSVSLRATFPNKGGLLHSGGAGNVILPNAHDNCIVVPQDATFEIQDKRFVYRLKDGKATAALIEVEPVSDGREFIVRNGLTAGDVIVAEGVGLLREGTPITPKKAPEVPADENTNTQAKEE